MVVWLPYVGVGVRVSFSSPRVQFIYTYDANHVFGGKHPPSKKKNKKKTRNRFYLPALSRPRVHVRTIYVRTRCLMVAHQQTRLWFVLVVVVINRLRLRVVVGCSIIVVSPF